jgi:XFP N-terminal domain
MLLDPAALGSVAGDDDAQAGHTENQEGGRLEQHLERPVVLAKTRSRSAEALGRRRGLLLTTIGRRSTKESLRCQSTPGSIHEGGELEYALAHAYGAAVDNPDLLVVCVTRKQKSP